MPTSTAPKLSDPGVEFDPDKHQYYVSNNGTRRQLPGTTSVTGIIDKSDPLMWWATNQMAEELKDKLEPGKEYDEIELEDTIENAKTARFRSSGTAKRIGTLVHAWIEDHIKDLLSGGAGEPDLPEHEGAQEAILEFLRWEEAHDVHYLASEAIVADLELGYAGTLDALAVCDKHPVVIDFKTSKNIYAEHHLQATAYLNAARKLSEGTKPRGYILLRVPKKKAEFETAECFDRDVLVQHFRAFKACLEVYRWQQQHDS